MDQHNVFFIIWIIFFVRCGYGEKIGDPNESSVLERPCPTYDLNCIRDFFSKHAHCKKAYGPAPDPITRAQSTVYAPRSNISITLLNEKIYRLNGKIEEFYINRDTDNLVIAVEFNGLNITSGNVDFKIHRRAKEPVVTQGRASIMYASVIITAVIPKLDNLQLKYSEFTTYANDAMPPVELSPSFAESSDPQVQQAFVEFVSNIPVDVREIFLTDASYYISTYIQYNICDFGLINL